MNWIKGSDGAHYNLDQATRVVFGEQVTDIDEVNKLFRTKPTATLDMNDGQSFATSDPQVVQSIRDVVEPKANDKAETP